MADDDGLGAWDDEDYAPPDVTVTGEYGEEVVRKIADQEEKKSESPAPAASQSKEKAKKQKGKEKPATDSIEETNAKQLTPQELEELQRASDLAAAADAFGVSLNSEDDSIDRFHPKSKEDFETFVNLLSRKIGSYQKSEHYYEFLSQLFTELSVKLDSKHILRFGKELTALASEKLKEEKEKERQKQPKSRKKPTLAMKGKSGGELDDVVGDATRGDDDYYDDDDFM